MTPSDEAALRAVIENGSDVDRWHLARQEDLPAWAYDAIFAAGDRSVMPTLAFNATCPPELLRRIAEIGEPDVAMLARSNPNAPVDVKDLGRLRDQRPRSVDVYLTEKGATTQQRKDFAEIVRQTGFASQMTVGQAWALAFSASAKKP